MKVTYIHHSGFLVETDSCYYLFDYEKGNLPCMDVSKSIIVLSSHGHHDHYNPEIFSMLKSCGMQTVYAILSDYLPASYVPTITGSSKDTTNYITRILSRVTVSGTVFLIILAIIPIIVERLTGSAIGSAIGGTGILIVVGVALETYKQIESTILSRNYETRNRRRRKI